MLNLLFQTYQTQPLQIRQSIFKLYFTQVQHQPKTSRLAATQTSPLIGSGLKQEVLHPITSYLIKCGALIKAFFPTLPPWKQLIQTA
jgi:hypothetical protein